jgi:hypothetical protein
MTAVGFFLQPPGTTRTAAPPGTGIGAGGLLHRHQYDSASGAHGESQVYYLRYGATPRLELGIGYWGSSEKPRPSVAWQVVPQASDRPALLVGYGSEPMGNWQDDGVYLSFVKGFGPAHRPRHAFLAYYYEIDGGTQHLMGGVNQPLGPRWSLFVGRYPFNTWEGSLSYQLSPQIQLGLWAADFGRSARLGVSVGTGWQLRRK